MECRKLVICLGFLLAFSLFFNPAKAWWDENWEYRRAITITEQSGNNLTDYQVAINLTYDSDMQPDFSDIRFTFYNSTSGEEIEIPYWIEEKVDSSWAYVWIKVPEIPASSTATVYVYYKNPSATSESNQSAVCPGGIFGERCLEYWEDFEDETNGQSPATNWNCTGMKACWEVVANGDNYYKNKAEDYDRSGSWEYERGIDISNGIFAYAKFQIASHTGSRAQFPLAFVDLYHGDMDDRITGYTHYSGYLGISFLEGEGKLEVWRINSTGGKEVHTTSVTISTGTTYVTKMFYQGNEIKVEFDGTNYTFTFTEGITEKTGYIGVGTENSVDWVYELGFGKFAEPEPTYEIGNAEGSIVIEIYSPQPTTYETIEIPLNFTVYGNQSSYPCWKIFNGEETFLGNILNASFYTENLTASVGENNLTIKCEHSQIGNVSKTVAFDVNLSLTVNFFDEETREPLVVNATVLIGSYSFSFENVTNLTVGGVPDHYSISARANGYSLSEYYSFVPLTHSHVVNVYLLPNQYATPITITRTGCDNTQRHVVIFERLYGDNSVSVKGTKLDFNCNGIVYLRPYDVYYRVVYYVDGQLCFSSDYFKVSTDIALPSCEGVEYETHLGEYLNITYNCSKDNRTIICQVQSPSAYTFNFKVTKGWFGRKITICEDSDTGNTVTFSCEVPSDVTEAWVLLQRAGGETDLFSGWFDWVEANPVLSDLVILSFILIAGAGLSVLNPIIGIILIDFGLFVSAQLGILAISTPNLIGILLLSGIIIYIVIRREYG